MNTVDMLHLAHWAAQECEWQESGELSVYRMLQAWDFAHSHRNANITVEYILEIGRLVDPKLNTNGVRKGVIYIGWEEKKNWHEIPRQLENLCEIGQFSLSPTHFFTEFEVIHPFLDGNGRTGAILYNWLNHTLAPHDVVFPPNVFADGRR